MILRIIIRLLILLAIVPLVTAQSPPSPPTSGARLFERQCAPCHDGMPGAPGPDLTDVVGARVADRQDFAYSSALRKTGGFWTSDRLDRFLASPAAFAPGTRMAVAVRDPAERRAVIAALSGMRRRK